jgi:hypothetical protein
MRLIGARFNRDLKPRPCCPTCRGLGTVWILSYGYDEWNPESWPREACPKCRTAPFLESIGFRRSDLRLSVDAA